MTFYSKKLINDEDLSFRKILGAYLKYQREYDTLSLNYVADSLHMNKGYLSEVENGKKSLPLEHYEKLMRFFDIQFCYDKSILDELRLKLYQVFESYINIDYTKQKCFFEDVLSQKERYENSAGFFIFQLFSLFYTVRFKANDEDKINTLIELLERYLYIFTQEEAAIFYDIVAQYYLAKNRKECTVIYLEKARKYCPEETNTIGLKAIILYHLVILLQQTNKSSLAFIYCKDAINEFRKHRIYNRLFYLDIYEATCLSRMHLYQEAEAAYLSILEHTISLNDKKLMSTIYTNLSWNSLKAKQYEDSIAYANKAIELGHESKQVYVFIAYCLFKCNKENESLNYMSELNVDKIGQYNMELIKIIQYRITKEDHFIPQTQSFLKLCHEAGDYETELLVMSMQLEYYIDNHDYERIAIIQNKIIAILTDNNWITLH